MSDSTSSTTPIGDGMLYRVTHTARQSEVAERFARGECYTSNRFFCHEDPKSPFFEFKLVFGRNDDCLGISVAVHSLLEKALSITMQKYRLYDVEGGLLAEAKVTDRSPWRRLGDPGWGLDRFYEPVDALSETEWKLLIEFEYEKEGSSLPSSPTAHNLQCDLLKLLEDPTNADVTFIVQGETIKAHKIFLSIRSKYFQCMLTSDVDENVNGEVKVPDIEPETFRGLLHFLYSGLAPENIADKALDLLLVADKYGVDELKQICEEKAPIRRDNVVNVLLVADSIKNEKLMTRAKAVFRSNVDELMASVDDIDTLKAYPDLLLQLISHYAKQ